MSEEVTKHTFFEGKLHLYKRPESDVWQCSAFLGGKNHRKSTGEEGVARAKEIATDWYLGLLGKARSGELKSEKTFREAAAQFQREYPIITGGERNPDYVKSHDDRLRVHLLPFFGTLGLSQITSGKAQEYRVQRHESATEDDEDAEEGKKKPKKRPPARSTLHHEFVTLRQVLKTAIRHGWLDHLPDLSVPYRASGKIRHRAWFSPEEYRKLYEHTRGHAREGKGKTWQWAAEQLHDYVLFMANTGLRPDEANNLEHRDVTIIEDEAVGGRILEIEVRGKRGVGYCKSTVGAVRPFERILERNNPKPADRLFPARHKKQFNRILEKLDLKFDRDGNRRSAYSLRHTYICMRLMEGANIYQLSKNCRTSVEMIEKFYATHIKTSLDSAAINVRRRGTRQTPQVSDRKR